MKEIIDLIYLPDVVALFKDEECENSILEEDIVFAGIVKEDGFRYPTILCACKSEGLEIEEVNLFHNYMGLRKKKKGE